MHSERWQAGIDTLKQTLHSMNDGTASLKAAAAGVTVLASAIWGALTSLLAAVLGFTWVLDMASGMILAWDQGTWDWKKFWSGFRKLAIAGVAIGLGVAVDAVLSLSGAEWQFFAAATMGLLIAAFGGSAAQNIGRFFPATGEFLEGALERLPRPSAPTQEEVEQAAEVRHGNPPQPLRGRLNGTDN